MKKLITNEKNELIIILLFILYLFLYSLTIGVEESFGFTCKALTFAILTSLNTKQLHIYRENPYFWRSN